MWDEDPWADVEALENERYEADFEMAEMTRHANAAAAARKAGRCTHGSSVGYAPPARQCYPKDQAGLKPGQSRCTDGCRRVFGSNEEWVAAIDEAVYGR